MTPKKMDERMQAKRQQRARLLAEIQAASDRFQAVCQTLGDDDLSAEDVATLKANLMILRGTRVSLEAEIAALEDRLGKALATGASGFGREAWAPERPSPGAIAQF